MICCQFASNIYVDLNNNIHTTMPYNSIGPITKSNFLLINLFAPILFSNSSLVVDKIKLIDQALQNIINHSNHAFNILVCKCTQNQLYTMGWSSAIKNYKLSLTQPNVYQLFFIPWSKNMAYFSLSIVRDNPSLGCTLNDDIWNVIENKIQKNNTPLVNIYDTLKKNDI